jgi:nucleotide-binding universal stress UspA family protein
MSSAVVQRILMIVDGSFAAEAAARYSLALARAYEAELELLFVAGDSSRSAINRAEESLLRLFRQAQSLGLKVRSVTEAGEPSRVIREHVAREGITLAVLPFKDPGVAARLWREVSCPVLLVRVAHPGRMAWPHEILVPLYHGEFEGGGMEQAADLLAKLGRHWESRILLFQLRRPLTRLFERRPLGEVPPEQEGALREFAAALRRRGLAPAMRVAWGRRAGPVITAEAAARRHDLIFLGTKGPTGFARWLRAGTVEHVARSSPCDLMVFRPAPA